MLQTLTHIQNFIDSVTTPLLVLQENRVVATNLAYRQQFQTDYSLPKPLSSFFTADSLETVIEYDSLPYHLFGQLHPSSKHSYRIELSLNTLPLADEIFCMATVHLTKSALDKSDQTAHALLETATMLSRELSTSAILDNIIDALPKIIPYDSINIMQLEENGARIIRYQGYPAEFGNLDEKLMPLDTPSLQTMIALSKPFRVSNTLTDPNWHQRRYDDANDVWAKSYLGIPIQTSNRILGFINLNSRIPDFFTPQHEYHLEAFANQVAVALENALLYESAQDEIAERERAEAARLESENRFRILAKNSPDAFLIISLDPPKSDYLNDRPFLGYNRDLLRTPGFRYQIIHSDDVDWVKAKWENLENLIEADSDSMEYRAKSQEGKWEWIHNRRQVLRRDAQGYPQQLLVILSIITEQKEAEQALAKRNQELQAMNNIATAIGQSLDIHTVLNELLSHLQHLVPYDSASITRISSNQMIYLAGRGLPDSIQSQIPGLRVEFSDIPSAIIKSQDTRRIDDVHDYHLWHHIPETDYIRSWMGVPLAHQGRTLGILNLDKAEPHFYTDSHQHQAETIARQVAVVIDNLELYQKSQKEIADRRRAESILIAKLAETSTHNWVAETLIQQDDLPLRLQAIVNRVAQSILANQVQLITLDKSESIITRMVFGGEDFDEAHELTFDRWKRSLAGRAYHLKKTIVASNEHGGDDFLMPNYLLSQTDHLNRPMIVAVIDNFGTLTAIRSSDDPDFSDEHIKMLTTIAHQLATTIENHEVNEELLRYNEQLELDVQDRTQRLQALLDSTGEGIFYLEDYIFQYVNPAFNRMMGYAPDELKGQQLTIIQTPIRPHQKGQVSWFDNLLTALLNGNVGRDDVLIQRKDGHEFYASLTFTLIGEVGDTPVRIVAVARDVSRERELREQKDRFIANAAHELRNPLASFDLRLHMMKRQPENIDKHVNVLGQVTAYVNHLLEELMDVTRFEQGKIRLNASMTEMQRLIQEVIIMQEPLLNEKSLRLNLQLGSPIEMVVDRYRIQQVLINLLVNAINYSDAHGEIIIASGFSDEVFWFSVEDAGPGIEPKYLPDLIFEPFHRANIGDDKGTGLGLTISKEIVQMHGGMIGVDSVLHQGSTFTVTLPRYFLEETDPSNSE